MREADQRQTRKGPGQTTLSAVRPGPSEFFLITVGALFCRQSRPVPRHEPEIEFARPVEGRRDATVKAIAPTFDGINLEDIKVPECFANEETLHAALDIPLFHDDQHGTAIISGVVLLNALRYAVSKHLVEMRVCFSGAGAAAILRPTRSASFCSSATSQFGRWVIQPIGPTSGRRSSGSVSIS